MNKLPFVWELDNKGVISHAIGTHHYCPFDFTEQVKPFVNGKNAVITETGIADFAEARKRVSDIAAKTYTDRLSPKHQQKISRMLAPITLEMLRELPLVNIYGLFGQKSVPDTQIKFGIDATIERFAQTANVPIHSIETFDEGVGYCRYIVTRFGEQLGEWLEWEDEQFSHGKRTAKLMVEAYLSGDEKRMRTTPSTLGQTLDQYLKKNPELGTMRHKPIAERTIPYLTSPALVGVGVAHFITELSVLDFYKEKGITVKRIQ